MNFAKQLGEKKAWENRTAIYLASSAMAEFIADLFLCPLEAIRIKSVSDPTFPKGVAGGIKQVLSTQGVGGLYAGLGPILFKQVRRIWKKKRKEREGEGEREIGIIGTFGKVGCSEVRVGYKRFGFMTHM